MTIEAPQRRYADLAPKNVQNDEVARINSDAKQGRRQTDSELATKLSKADRAEPTKVELVIGELDLIVSRTDEKGIITYCNNQFVESSGWKQEELMGSNHNLICHPDMPKLVYKLMWDTIKKNKEFYGHIKNLRKDGGFYWVFACMTADFDDDEQLVGYTSTRKFVPDSTIKAITPIYKLLAKTEMKYGMSESKALLRKILKQGGFSTYDQFALAHQLDATNNK